SPPSLYLRETALTTTDGSIAALAAASRDAGRTSALDVLHSVLRRLHAEMIHETAARHTAIAAAEAFARKTASDRTSRMSSLPPPVIWVSLRAMSAAITDISL